MVDGYVYVLESDGRVWAVHENDINNSCARCRGVDRTNWSIYKMLMNSGQVAPSVLSVLAQDDELEDPNCVKKFGKRLPLMRIDEDSELRIIDNESCDDSDDLQSALRYALGIINKCWKL